MADFLWAYADVIRITLGIMLAGLAMDVAEQALFDVEDSDDGNA